MKKTIKASIIATAIAAMPLGAGAAGLGAINVFSGLGQPLRAEIELNATPQELQSLSARVANADAFQQANVTYSPLMNSIRLNVETRGNRSVVRVTSDRPVNEPFLDLVVELNWAAGRALREYTFLLDPVDISPPPATAAAATPAAAPSSARPVSSPRPAPAASASAPVSPPVQPTDPAEYRVTRGDTLGSIAARFQPADTNLDQMLIALLRENPSAFDGGNINRLRAGAVLRIPDAAEVVSVDRATARREIVAQAADFAAYRNRLAGTVATREPARAPEAQREQSGAVVARVEEPQAAEPTDRVEVSGSAAKVAETESDVRTARLQALEEELVAREKALEEAGARLGELEGVIRDLQRLIEVRNQDLAELQQQVAAAPVSPPPAPVEQPAPVEAPVPPPAVEVPVPVPPAVPVQPEEVVEERPPVDLPDEELAGEGEASEDVAVEDVVEERVPEVQTPQPVVEPAPVVEAAPPPAPPAVQPAPAAPVAPPPERKPASQPAPPVEEPSFLSSMLADPMMLGGGGAVLALLLGYGAYRTRQSRKAREMADHSLTLMSEEQSGAHSVFGVKGGQAVDTGSSSVLHTDFSQSGLASIDADEGVDPVAEADVYMAYGREAQAEEILLDALKADSGRPAVFLKLLEVYALRPDVKKFEAIATDFYSRTGGAGADWVKAAEMGRKVDPENPLYAERNIMDADGFEAPETEPGTSATPSRSKSDAAAAAALTGAAAAAAAEAAAAESGGAEMPGLVDLPDLDEPVPAADVDGDVSLSDVDFTESLPVEPSESQMKSTWTVPGDMRQLAEAVESGSDDELTAALDKAAHPQEEAPEMKADTSVLDFDLGLDDMPSGESQEEVDESHFETSQGLTFELDDDVASAGKAEAPAMPDIEEPAGRQEPALAPSSDEIDLPFDLGDSVDTSSLDEGVVSSSASASGFVTQQSAPGDISMDATVLESDGLLEEDSAEMDLEKTGFDNNLLDFDFDLESAASNVAEEVPALDLSNIDLDLDSVDASQGSDDGMPSLDDSGMGGEQDEVDTKLDLARAYEDMGDSEGARELIEEVMREGSPDQVAKAKDMLARLG